MLHSLLPRAKLSLLICSLLALTGSADRIIESKSLMQCMDDSKFSASLFQVNFNPDTRIIKININGISDINSNVTAIMRVVAYGYKVMENIIDPCDTELKGMCPMQEGIIDQEFTIADISPDVIASIPGVFLPQLLSPL